MAQTGKSTSVQTPQEQTSQKQPQQSLQQRREPQGALQRPGRETQLGRSEWSSPFSLMRRFMEQMDDLFSPFGIGPLETFGGGGWVPAVETLRRDNDLVLRVELPGLSPDNVRVEVTGDELVISGERKQEEEQTRGGRYYSEMRYGSFERRMTLPEGCDPNKIGANFDNGVLEIKLPMPQGERQQTKKIDIKSGSGGGPGSIH